MPEAVLWSVGLILIVTPASAGDSGTSARHETWYAAYLQGVKSGFVRTTVTQIRDNGRLIHKASRELNLTVKRFQDTVKLRMETGSEEADTGKVLAVSMRQWIGDNLQLSLRGTAQGDRMHLEVSGGQRLDKDISWTKDVLGLYQQETIFRQRHVKPGDCFTYQAYEPTITAVITMRVTVKNDEEVELADSRLKQRLLRIEVTPDKIGSVQLPAQTLWLDQDLTPVVIHTEMPGLGKLALYRSSRAAALGAGGAAPLLNIGVSQMIPVNRRILRPYDTEAAVYRITIKGDDDPATTFARDARQVVQNVKADSFELHIKTIRRPVSAALAAAAPEYLKSSYFINCADPRVRELALRAVATETDAWHKALRIEKWVHDQLTRKNLTDAIVPSERVARTLQGDCKEHAILTAAMCRAVGVPSRTAIGLLYVDRLSGPAFGFHMWTEVFVDGQWLPIDATLGRGYIGATHLKISDSSWSDTQSLTPLLPVIRVVGKASIQVLRVNGGE
jgi:hypothetical protein